MRRQQPLDPLPQQQCSKTNRNAKREKTKGRKKLDLEALDADWGTLEDWERKPSGVYENRGRGSRCGRAAPDVTSPEYPRVGGAEADDAFSGPRGSVEHQADPKDLTAIHPIGETSCRTGNESVRKSTSSPRSRHAFKTTFQPDIKITHSAPPSWGDAARPNFVRIPNPEKYPELDPGTKSRTCPRDLVVVSRQKSKSFERTCKTRNTLSSCDKATPDDGGEETSPTKTTLLYAHLIKNANRTTNAASCRPSYKQKRADAPDDLVGDRIRFSGANSDQKSSTLYKNTPISFAEVLRGEWIPKTGEHDATCNSPDDFVLEMELASLEGRDLSEARAFLWGDSGGFGGDQAAGKASGDGAGRVYTAASHVRPSERDQAPRNLEEEVLKVVGSGSIRFTPQDSPGSADEVFFTPPSAPLGNGQRPGSAEAPRNRASPPLTVSGRRDSSSAGSPRTGGRKKCRKKKGGLVICPESSKITKNEPKPIDAPLGPRFFLMLPYEILLEIFSHLASRDLNELSHTCSDLQILNRRDGLLWRRRIWRDYPYAPCTAVDNHLDPWYLYHLFSSPKIAIHRVVDTNLGGDKSCFQKTECTTIYGGMNGIRKAVILGNKFHGPRMIILTNKGRLCEFRKWTSMEKIYRDVREATPILTPFRGGVDIQGGHSLVVLTASGDLWCTYQAKAGVSNAQSRHLNWHKLASDVLLFAASTETSKPEVALTTRRDPLTLTFWLHPKLLGGADPNFSLTRSLRLPRQPVYLLFTPNRILCRCKSGDVTSVLTRESRDSLILESDTPFDSLNHPIRSIVHVEGFGILCNGLYSAYLLTEDVYCNDLVLHAVKIAGRQKPTWTLPRYRPDVVVRLGRTLSADSWDGALLISADMRTWLLRVRDGSHRKGKEGKDGESLFSLQRLTDGVSSELSEAFQHLHRNFVHSFGEAMFDGCRYTFALQSNLDVDPAPRAFQVQSFRPGD